ncbi:MAG: hypothetical protein U0800_16610 [Isosphaeraceae bacterium]
MRRFRSAGFAPLLGLALLAGIPSQAVPEPAPGGGRGQGQGKGQQAELMKRKLGASQKILEGLALENFETIGKGARELKAISEDSAWNAFPDSDYAHYSREFRSTCDQIQQQARDKNLDAVTLSYVRLTMSCVQCHKFVRLQRP